MYRTPPDDGADLTDEQIDTAQRHRRVASPGRQQPQNYGNDQPELPKVRRASRRLDPEAPMMASSARLARIERPLSRQGATTHRPTPKLQRPDPTMRRPRTERPPLRETSTRMPSVRRPAVYEDETVEERRHPAPGRVMLSGKKRPVTYEPVAVRRPHIYDRGRRRPATLIGLLQDLSHRKPVLIGALTVLLLLILLPISFTVLSGNQQSSNSSFYGNDPASHLSSGSSSNGGQVQNNGHEIVITPINTDHPAPVVFATAAYVMDADTGATLYARNPFTHLPMLSTTKLMTATLAVENGNLDQKITITDAIYRDISQLSADSSVMGIKKGETYTLRDLLYGLMLVSGNDAALAIADGLNGNVQSFVDKMNQRAHSLGMLDTHYMNPHGLLAKGHYSSAHDLAIIGRHAMSLPTLHQISGTRQYDLPKTAEHPEHHFINGNQFLWWYPGVDGGKPGFDGVKNFLQVVSCTRNNHHLIGVTMNTINWWTDMRDLMNWGFDTYTWVSPYITDQHTLVPFDNQWNYFRSDKQENFVPAADGSRYYVYTGYTVANPVLSYFDSNNGLKKFGYPTGQPKAAGDTTISQQFEHGKIVCDINSHQCKTQ